MPWYEEDYNPWAVWLSKPSAGRFAHPNAPLGGSGYGPGRVPPGGTEDPCWTWGVPHPNSPAGRFVTGPDAASGYLTFEFEKACQRVTNANTWEKLRSVTERVVGPQTFGLGVCYGFVKNPVVSVGQLLELQKTFIEADLYDQLTRQLPWWKRLPFGSMFSSPGAILLITALIKTDKMSAGDLKRAYETREALLKEIGVIFDHPGEFLETLKGETKANYRAKWIRFKTLQQKTDLSSQFEAGEIFGDVLVDLVMLILTVVSVVGAARQAAAQSTRIASRLPQLTRVAEYFRGIRAAEAGAAAEEAAQAAKGASKAGKAAVATKKEMAAPKNGDYSEVGLAGRARTVSSAEAEDMLIKSGRSAEQAKDYVASFDGPITARTVEPGESFVRYTDAASSKGGFLTKTKFSSPAEASEALYLKPYGNNASLMQDVTAMERTVVLEGGVANGTPGVQQTLILNRNAFQVGIGKAF